MSNSLISMFLGAVLNFSFFSKPSIKSYVASNQKIKNNINHLRLMFCVYFDNILQELQH